MPEMSGSRARGAHARHGAHAARPHHLPHGGGARSAARLSGCYEARGAVDFLFKPIDPHVLRSKADIFFQLHRQKAELAHNLRMNEMFVGILGHGSAGTRSTPIVTGAHLLGRQLTDEAPRRTLGR